VGAVCVPKNLYPPIDYALSLFSIHLPPAGKDLLVLYLAAGGILYRTLSYDRASPLKDRFPKTWRTRIRIFWMRASKVLAAVLWPYVLCGLLRKPGLLIVSQQGYHGRLPPPRRDLSSAERKKVIETLLVQIGHNARVLCNERQLLATYAIGLLIAVICLVVLNAAIDGLSDKLPP
jgi:hypothetical protein